MRKPEKGVHDTDFNVLPAPLCLMQIEAHSDGRLYPQTYALWSLNGKNIWGFVLV